MKSKVTISLDERSYPILIDSNAFGFEKVEYILRHRKIVILSNKTIAPLYLDSVINELKPFTNSEILNFNWPDGEQYKNLTQWSNALDFLAEHKVTRGDLLISLGGGVVCDMTGYLAASWMRGIDFIQIPTTLLAQIDASVGGKTAINHKSGKNLIGAFHQPKAVLINSSVLKSLNSREYLSGLGEAIKYGYINQPQFIEWVANNTEDLLNKDPIKLNQLIESCCQFKAEIVSQDEKEQGKRALLNFGHTFGHALETLSNYKHYLHGEAVAIGMVMAIETSKLLGISSNSSKQQLINLLTQLQLPSKPSSKVSALDIVKCMRLDKKFTNNQHRLIVFNDDTHHAEIRTDIEESLIIKAIESCL